jgi:hypothetical protein
MFDRIDLLFVLDGDCIASTAEGRNRKNTTGTIQIALPRPRQGREQGRRVAALLLFAVQKGRSSVARRMKSALGGVCQSCAVLRNPMLECLILNKVQSIDDVIEICNALAVLERHGGIFRLSDTRSFALRVSLRCVARFAHY